MSKTKQPSNVPWLRTAVAKLGQEIKSPFDERVEDILLVITDEFERLDPQPNEYGSPSGQEPTLENGGLGSGPPVEGKQMNMDEYIEYVRQQLAHERERLAAIHAALADWRAREGK